jgi:hypothetical protein
MPIGNNPGPLQPLQPLQPSGTAEESGSKRTKETPFPWIDGTRGLEPPLKGFN